MLIDTHAHLTSDEMYEEYDEVLERAKAAGLDAVININTDRVTLERALEKGEEVIKVYQTGGTPPHDVEKEGDLLFPFFEEKALGGQLVALGEVGLDYYYEHSDRKAQKALLVRYFNLAKRAKLPMVFHCREAFDDLFQLSDKHYGGRGIVHCFTGTLEEGKRVLERGWLISMSGIVTFKKSEGLREVVKGLPLSSLVLETDAPYLAPEGHRGKRNEPSYIVKVAEVVADVKGVSIEEVIRVTGSNAREFFSL